MLSIKLEKENTLFDNLLEQISVKPFALTVVLVSSMITMLSVKPTDGDLSNTSILTKSRVTKCAKTFYHGGRARSTRRYFWRPDCPAGWHQVR